MADVLRKYAQIRRNGNVVCLVGDESLGMPITESHCVYTVDLKGHPQQNEVEENMIYNAKTDTFSWGEISYDEEYNPYQEQCSITLLADGWKGDTAPYVQTVDAPGIGPETAGVIGVCESATDEQFQAALDAVLRKSAQATGSVTVKAYGDKPTVDIPIVIIIE